MAGSCQRSGCGEGGFAADLSRGDGLALLLGLWRRFELVWRSRLLLYHISATQRQCLDGTRGNETAFKMKKRAQPLYRAGLEQGGGTLTASGMKAARKVTS